MKQKLSDWASAAEIVSGIAVVVTLVILIVGVRENTEITRTAMYAGTLDQFNAFETEMLSNPNLLPIYNSYLYFDTAELGQEERDSLSMMVAILFRTLDRAFSANQNRQLGDDEWARVERSLCTNYQRAESSGHLWVVEFLTTSSFWEYAVRTCSEFTGISPQLQGGDR